MGFEAAIKKAVEKVSQISGIGTSVTIRRVVTGQYNTTTGEMREVTTDTAVKGVMEDVNQREVNEIVQADDRKLVIPANSVSTAPSTSDRVIIGGDTHQIIRVKTQDQAGVAITYELILRA